jgi:acyl-CoA thioester hydrolase
VARIHLERFAVGADAIDDNRHVGNLAYLRWMQDAATAHSVAQGWPLERYRAAGAGWFVRSHFIEYLRPALAGDTLLLYTWVRGMTGLLSPRRYLFVRENDSLPVAEAETLWVFVDFATGRPVRIAPEVVAAFPIVPDDDPELVALAGRPVRRTGGRHRPR